MTTIFTSEATITTTINLVTISFGGTLDVIGSGTVSSALMVDDSSQLNDPILNLSAGGIAAYVTVSAGSGVFVNAQGEVRYSIIEYNGIQQVDAGGTSVGSTILAGGAELVSDGGLSVSALVSGGAGVGTSSNVTAFAQGKQIVSSGGEAYNSTISSGGILEIYEQGISKSAEIDSSGRAVVYNGGYAQGITVDNGGQLFVEAGGTINGATIESGGTIVVLPGGCALNVSGSGKLIDSGVFGFSSSNIENASTEYFGNVLSGTSIAFGASIYATAQSTVSNVNIADYSTIVCEAGATLISDTVSQYGTVLLSGGISTDLQVDSGTIIIQPAGFSDSTNISNGGIENVTSGGYAEHTNISSSGIENIMSGGSAFYSTIQQGGLQIISNGGTSSNPLVKEGGIVLVSSGGSIINPTIQTGGVIVDLARGEVIGSSVTPLGQGIIDINESTGAINQGSNITEISNGNLGLISGSIDNIAVESGATLYVLPGSTIHSIELNGGELNISQGSNVNSVTIQIGEAGSYTNSPLSDISRLLNTELRSIPEGTTITILFNPGCYGASSTVYLGSNTSVIGNNATLGAIGSFSGNSLFENVDQQVTGENWTINNTDGSTTTVQAMDGGQLNLLTITNNAYLNPTTTVVPQLPLLATQYAVGDTSTPIVDKNITISGMNFVENGTYAEVGASSPYGYVSRSIWFSDVSNISVDRNIMIGGYSGLSLIDTSNAVIAQNVIIGSPVAIDSWSGPSNLIEENNTIWEYSNGNPLGSTGAIQLNASANGYASDPGVNSNGTTTNDGLIGNVITGSGPATSAIAADPLYPYGHTSEQNVTQQGNIDNSLGNQTGGFYTANVQSATLTDNIYAGGSASLFDSASADNSYVTSITTANGNVSGNLVLVDGSVTSSNEIFDWNIDPTTVDNAVLGNGTASENAISSWGFTGTATAGGNLVSGNDSVIGSPIAPPLEVVSSPYISISSTVELLTGTSAPQILDSNTADEANFSVTLTSVFGTITSSDSVCVQYSTVSGGQSAYVLDGSLSEVNDVLSHLTYSTNGIGVDDAIEINANDGVGNNLSWYIPILWNANNQTSSSLVQTITAGFIEAPSGGLSLSGEMIVCSGGQNIIAMGSTVSAAFVNGGSNTVLGGSTSEYISANAGFSNIVLSPNGDITVAGGTGSFTVNAQLTKSSSQTLIEAGEATSSITGGAGAMTVVGGQGNLYFTGGSGSNYITTAADNGGIFDANLGAGNSTVFCLSGECFVETSLQTHNVIVLGFGSSTVFSSGDDLIKGGAGSLDVQVSGASTSITGGAGASTINAGQGSLTYQGGSGTTVLNCAANNGGNLTALLGSGNSTVVAASGNALIQSQSGTNNIITAGKGSDTVLSFGNDSIEGGAGSLDVQVSGASTSITGGAGASTINAGQGSLTYQGGSGTTVLNCAANNGGDLTALLGSGNSTVVAASGNALIQSQSGTNNIITAGTGSDTVLSFGNDSIEGGAGSLDVQVSGASTSITGGAGASTINAGQGSLTYQGGSGTTVLNCAANNGGDLTALLGSGNSTVVAASGNALIQSQPGTNNIITAGTGSDTVLSFGNDSIEGGAGSLNVQVSGASTSITGGAGASTINAGQGSLTYQGGSGTTVLNCAANNGGNLTALLGSGNSTVVAASGNALIQSQSGTNNIITGGTGSDTVLSFGNDLIFGGQGEVFVTAAANAQDTVIAGTGEIVGENLGAASSLSIRADSVGGLINVGKNSCITVTSSNNTVQAASASLVNNVAFSGNASSNVINLGGSDYFVENDHSTGFGNELNVAGDTSSGFISSNSINTVSVKGAGNMFVINTRASILQSKISVYGADTILAVSNKNLISAGSGAVLYVTSSDNTISGGNLSLTLQGQNNLVNLSGNATVSDANPWSYATANSAGMVQNQFTVQSGQFNLGGQDQLMQLAGSAALTLAGGSNATLGGSQDSITATDQVYGGNAILLNGANDSVSLINVEGSAATISAAFSAFVRATDDTGAKIGATNDNSNESLTFIAGSSSSNTIMAAGSNTAVTLFGGLSNYDIVSGGNAGNNSLNGGSGIGDLLKAGGNNDVLIGGGGGYNTLVSAVGNETLTGAGLGNDLYSVTGGGGTDLIGNFSGQLVLAAGLSVSSEVVSGGSMNLILNDGTRLILAGIGAIHQTGSGTIIT